MWLMPFNDYPALQLSYDALTNGVSANIETAVEIFWDSESNAIYVVQWRDDLNTNHWRTLTPPIEGTGEELSAFDATRGLSNRFYRVLSDETPTE